MRPKELCGFAGWHPEWLQKFSNVKTFMIVYGLLGTTQGMAYLYFIVTLTTIEKRFKIPSQTTGIILSGNELSQIMLSLILSYVGGQRNRPKWISYGMILCSVSCFTLALPHFMYGPGDDALQLTKEYSDEYRNNSLVDSSSSHSHDKLCLGAVTSESCDELFSIVPLVLMYTSQFVLGIGQTLYFSLGQSYLDDGTRRSNTPMMLAYAMSLRMCGPVAGYGLGYLTLKWYIDPTKTPLIDNTDPRWLGAWWIGWIFLGIPMLLFSFLIRMFPRRIERRQKNHLHEEELINGKDSETSHEVPPQSDDLLKLKDFRKVLMELLKNKVLIYNITSTVFYILGSTGYTLFLSKYIEVQYNKSPSDATILTGPLTVAGMVTGFLASGLVIKRYKPSPSKLFFWNVIVGTCFIIGQLSYMFLGCEHSSLENLATNLTSKCNVDCYCDDVSYSPVCSVKTGTTFYSPCHAACNQWNYEKKIYSGCSCSAETLDVNVKNSTFLLKSVFKSDTTEKSLTSTTFLATQANYFPTISTAKFFTKISEIDDKISQYANGDVEQQTGLRRSKTSIYEEDDNFVEDIMTPGPCFAECAKAFYLFTCVMFAVNWLNSTGRVGNILLQLRAVADKDKAFSQGLSLMLVALFAFSPAPIIYGHIIDSTCIVWNYKCESRGNCQLYDADKFRYYVNITAICLTFVGVVFDLLVWRHAKNINLYSESDDIHKQIEQRQLQHFISKNSLLCRSLTSIDMS